MHPPLARTGGGSLIFLDNPCFCYIHSTHIHPSQRSRSPSDKKPCISYTPAPFPLTTYFSLDKSELFQPSGSTMLTTVILIVLSTVHGHAKPNSDLVDLYRQQLDHDLTWDDRVDGSYDLEDGDTGSVRTRFRGIANGLAWIITSTPVPAVRGRVNLHQEMPLYLHYGVRETPEAVTFSPVTTETPEEVEIVLGKKDEDSDDDDGEDDEKSDDEEEDATSEATTTTTAHLVIQPGRPIVTVPSRLSHHQEVAPAPTFDVEKRSDQPTDSVTTSLIIPITVGILGSVLFGGVIAFLMQRRSRARQPSFDEENSYGYGISRPIPATAHSKGLTLDLTNDRLLAKSAETYHYQQQRRSMISSSGSSSRSGSIMHEKRVEHSDYDTEEEEGDGVAAEYGDYTVYECPGLAPPGEFEVVNPLFADQNESVIEVVQSED